MLKINFQILTPEINIIKIPKSIILKAVPRSGCVTTNITGIAKAKIGRNKNFSLLTSPVETR